MRDHLLLCWRSLNEILNLPELDRRLISGGGVLPEQQPTSTGVVSARHGVLHFLSGLVMSVEDVSAILVVVANYNVQMAISIEISQRRRPGEPSFPAANNLAWSVALVRELHPCFFVLFSGEPDDGRTSPISHDDVHQPIFVKVAWQTAHRSHHGRVI